MTPKELVMEAVAAIFINFDPSAAEQLLAKDYIQHNPPCQRVQHRSSGSFRVFRKVASRSISTE